MPIFSRKSKSNSSDDIVISAEDEVLAYLDEVFRKRIPMTIAYKGKELSGDIMFMDQKNRAMRMQMTVNPALNGAEVLVGFPLDRTWWAFKSKLVINQDKPHLLFPKAIARRERRKDPRTSFTAREQVKVTVMEGLGSGHGLFGMACDVSPNGICITIEKCMMLANEKEISPSPTLYSPNARLAFVKINKIPGMVMLETQGLAKRVFRDGNKWKCAIELDGLGRAERTAILRFIEPRLLEFKVVKRSMKAREDADSRRAEPSAGPSSRSASPSVPPPPRESLSSSAVGSPYSSNNSEEENLPDSPEIIEDSGPKLKVLVLGSELLEEMPFLEQDDRVELLIGTTPVSLIRILTEDNPSVVLCGTEFKGRSSLDILERISNMGMSSDRKILLCSRDLQSKDRIRFKMMKVDDFVDLPVADTDAFYTSLEPPQ